MDTTTVHYVSYDPDAIWREILAAYVDAGGDIPYPGDEKEMLLRAVLAVVTQVFAGVDNALRMDTLRYAVGDYLDIYGEKRNCTRIDASAAECSVTIQFSASGTSRTILAGTALTADGVVFYQLKDDVLQTGYEQTATVDIVCAETGSVGNGLVSGTQMQFAVPNPAVASMYTAADAACVGEREDDETYRERIRQYGLTNITTGPAVQYQSKAMSVSSEIVDAKALNLGAGSVGVYLILESDEGAEAILEAVEEALSAQEVRPLTDAVTVYEADDVEYVLNVEYQADSESDTAAAIQDAVSEYQDWQDNTIGRAFNPDKLMALIYQAGATRVIWGDESQFDGGDVEYTEIESSQRCKGHNQPGGDGRMMELSIENLFPQFLLNDKNGYALAKAIEKALEIVCEKAQTGVNTVLDVEAMPEWRLDEMAWELGCLYDYTATLDQKRKWIRESTPLYAAYGTVQAIYNYLQGMFNETTVEECWEYGGDPFPLPRDRRRRVDCNQSQVGTKGDRGNHERPKRSGQRIRRVQRRRYDQRNKRDGRARTVSAVRRNRMRQGRYLDQEDGYADIIFTDRASHIFEKQDCLCEVQGRRRVLSGCHTRRRADGRRADRDHVPDRLRRYRRTDRDGSAAL